MENKAINEVEISSFIQNFFKALESDTNYSMLLDQPFSCAEQQTNLYAYLNMPLIENTLRSLKSEAVSEIDTFMSNGLEWVNRMVADNANGLPVDVAKPLAHRYVNLLALLAGAPTIFMKIGALTMFATAPDVVKTWYKVS